MEIVPCSNVGHIYREFDRFGVDNQLKESHVRIGEILARNDARVAEASSISTVHIYHNYRACMITCHFRVLCVQLTVAGLM